MNRRELAGFSVAGFGQNLVYNFLALYLLVYLYDGLRLSPRGIASLTVILTVAKIWDALNDVAVGLLIDRTRTRWGTFRPWILVTAFPVAVLTFLLFAVPGDSETAKLIAIAVLYLLWDVFYTLGDVPYWSLTSVTTCDEPSRTKLVAASRFAGMAALAVMTLGGPGLVALLSDSDHPDVAGWARAAGLVSLTGMALFTVAFFATVERVPIAREPVAFGAAIRQLARNGPLFALLASGTVAFGRAVFQVGGAVVASVVFGSIAVFSQLGGAMIGGMVLATVLTPLMLRRCTRRAALIVANYASAVLYGVLYLAGYRSLILAAVVLALSGVLLGVATITQTTMIGDAADFAEVRTGVRSDGACFAGLTFVAKLTAALATMVFGLVVSGVGYQADAPVTDSMRQGVWLAATLIPAVSCLLSNLPLHWYRIPEAQLPGLLAASRANRPVDEKL